MWMFSALQSVSQSITSTLSSSSKNAVDTVIANSPAFVAESAVRLTLAQYPVTKKIKSIVATCTSAEMGQLLQDPESADPSLRTYAKIVSIMEITTAVFGQQSTPDDRIAPYARQIATLTQRIGSDLIEKNSSVRGAVTALESAYENTFVAAATNYTLARVKLKELRKKPENPEENLYVDYCDASLSDKVHADIAKIKKTNTLLSVLASPETGYSIARYLSGNHLPPLREETLVCHYGIKITRIISIVSRIFSPTGSSLFEQQVGTIASEIVQDIRIVSSDLAHADSTFRTQLVTALDQNNEKVKECRNKQNALLALLQSMNTH